MALYFIETRIFTKRIGVLGLEEELRDLQDDLLKNPTAGDIYLHLVRHGVVYLMFVYGKDEQPKLTVREKKQLKAGVEAIKFKWDERT